MESNSPAVPFPLLQTPIESNYRACTIPYRFPSDNPRKATPVELQWIDLFLKSVPSFRQRAESDPTVVDAPAKAEKFAQRYTEILEDMKKNPESHGGPPDCILLCQLREQVLRELGFRDIFKKVKDDENAKAISLFEDVVRLHDAIEDGAKRVENLIRGILAGNIFDLGSAQLAELFARDGMSFLASCHNLVSRPWVIDDLDDFKLKWNKKSWQKAVIFVDNSGADVVLGILPFARELLRRGTTRSSHQNLSDLQARKHASLWETDRLKQGEHNIPSLFSDSGRFICLALTPLSWASPFLRRKEPNDLTSHNLGQPAMKVGFSRGLGKRPVTASTPPITGPNKAFSCSLCLSFLTGHFLLTCMWIRGVATLRMLFA